MYKKHFNAIAKAIAHRRETLIATGMLIGGETESILDRELRGITADLCDTFEKLNPNFNRRRFIEACGFTLS